MAFDFPSNPTSGQVFTSDNGVSYTWNGDVWIAGVSGEATTGAGPVNFVDMFGAVGDGSTDNAPMWMAFNTYAKAESDAGRAVELYIPPGTYNYNHSLCQGFLFNIKKLVIDGDGAIIQNIYNRLASGDNFNFELPWGRASEPDLNLSGKTIGKLINTVGPGSTVTLITPADHSVFAIGDWVMVASYDLQVAGYPPNADRFEFVKVTAKNTTTGVITVSPPIKHTHRSDFPDWGNNSPIGKARIFPLNNAGVTWDVDHTYKGLEIRVATNSILTYTTLSGRRLRLENHQGCGLSQSIAGSVEMIGGKITVDSEPDKLVGSCLYDSVYMAGSTGFQSSSIDRVTLRDCTISGQLTAGTAKSILIENCDLASFNPAGATFGVNRYTTVLNSIVHAMDPAWLGDTGGMVEVTGTDVTFVNGVFRITKTSPMAYQWTAVPGAMVNLALGVGNAFSGNTGTGIITGVDEDATYVYLRTTLPYASLPAWASGKVRIQRNGGFAAINSTGCDTVRQSSEAALRGKPPWDFARFTFAGVSAASGYFGRLTGRLTRFYANVIQVSPSANTTLDFAKFDALTASALNDPQNHIITIDVMVKGIRDFSTTALVGKTTNDKVMLGAAVQTSLPADRWFDGGSYFWNYNNLTLSSFQPYQLPIIEIVMEFDNGIYRRALIEHDTGANSIAHVIGGI